ncbi:hypothetical protein PsYK624_102690 [Phanerochaete sordida]|uniref:Uncharacterized protein n=1 Tax=Phanerochaete sordida TaxID=48140 RepID=A0A9P3GFQ9_9APHY|nr:hypothetical protein PsYK624_102690 [Phanerochaete sordida]
MGKSRLAHEASRILVTIPLNIRRKEALAWPMPDDCARDFLEASRSIDAAYADQLAFFAAMLRCASSRISSLLPGRSYADEEDLAGDWIEFLEADNRRARNDFYKEVVQETRAILTDAGLPALHLEVKQWDPIARKVQARATEYLQQLVHDIEARLTGQRKHAEVALLIYIDEVYDLSRIRRGGSESFYDTLFRAFTALGPENPLFLLTITTHPAVALHANLPMRHQPPYSELPFDVLLDHRPLFSPNSMTLWDVAQPSFMANFGRPMFGTRQAAMKATQFDVRRFALQKLICSSFLQFRPQKSPPGPGKRPSLEIIFAILSTRLEVDFDLASEEARLLTEEMVYKHMRIAFIFPAHGDYIITGTPSEPLLAEAAAEFMCLCTDVSWLRELANAASRALIKITWRGDLLARLLLTLSFDRAGDPHRRASAWDGERMYSPAVPLVDFLQALFADQWHDAVLDAKAIGSAPDSVPLREAFEHAFVRFSHFIEFNGDHTLDAHVALAAVARGFAIRLVPTQSAISIAIPVVMKDEKLCVDLMSFIFIQLKTKPEPARRPAPDYLDRVFQGLAHTHPVIHIVMQLHPDKAVPEASIPHEDDARTEHPCYGLTAYGASSVVYKVLDGADPKHPATLLDSEPLSDSYLGQDSRRLFHQQRLKFEWSSGPATFDWMGDEDARPQVEETVEGVFAD